MSRLTQVGTLAAAALLAAVPLAGCTYIAPQTTTKSYDASDGVGINVGGVEIRDALIVTASADDPGRLLGSVINQGQSEATLRISAQAGGRPVVDDTVTVPAGGVVRLGPATRGEQDVLLTPAVAEPGALFGLTFSAGGQDQQVAVPVLDGTLKEYAPYVPTPTPAPTGPAAGAATPARAATPVPTATR